MKRAVERSKLDRKTNVELVETMWEQFCNLGIYESNVIETTTYSIQEAVFAVKEKFQVEPHCYLKRFLKIEISFIREIAKPVNGQDERRISCAAVDRSVWLC